MSTVTFLISLAVFLQTIESLWLTKILSSSDPWKRMDLRMGVWTYPTVLIFRLGAAAASMISPSVGALTVMLISTWVVALRFRGTFNGGSDGMTFHVLAATLVARIWPQLEPAALAYIAIQSCASYFVAGLSKLKNTDWWTGLELHYFLRYSHSACPSPEAHWLSGQPTILRGAAWAVILFELLFPLSLTNPTLALGFCAAGMAFHLGNYYFFGLNRFFFVWMATYPAIFAIATQRWVRL